MENLIMTEKQIDLPSHNVSISLVMDVVTRCYHGVTDLKSLITYTAKSGLYVKSAVCAGLLLGMIKELGENKYVIADDCPITSTPSNELKISIFRNSLEKWEAFIIYLRYVTNGDKSDTAARKLSSLYTFNKTPVQISQLLQTWAKGVGFLDSKGNIINIDPNFNDMTMVNKLSKEVFEEVNISLYLLDCLGEDVFKWLIHDEIEELKKSILIFRDNPREAIQCAGRAFEDVLRRIAIELNADPSKQNGITQVANFLYSNTDNSGIPLIHAKLKNISLAVGDIRNMAGHSKEAKSMERWELSPTAALGCVLTSIATIKAIYYFSKNSKYNY